MTFEQARAVLAALQQERVDYVLVGSMAMAAQGIVRATRDMDFFVDPTDLNIARLRQALRRAFGDDPHIDEIRADELAGEFPAIQYNPPGSSFSLDILARLGDAFGFADLEWEELQLEGTRVRVATARMLYLMKKDTLRPQDQLDAAMLRQAFELEGDA